MRSLGLCALLLLAAGCSGSAASSDGGVVDAGAGAPGCHATFSGDYADTAFIDGGCALLVPAPVGDGGTAFPECSPLAPGVPSGAGADGGPDWILQFQLPSSVVQATTTIQIDLGPTPSVGTFSTNTIPTWCAVAITPVGCEFSSGSESSSVGGFTLTLSALTGLESGAAIAHGSLEVQQYVEAPSATICGSSNEEHIHLDF